MDTATFARESALNRRAYAQLRDQIRREYAGKHVVLADGRVIGAAPSFDAATAIVKGLEGAPEYYLIFPADGDPDFDLIYDLAGSV